MVSGKGGAEAPLCEMIRLCERKIVFKPASEEANLVWAWPPGGGGHLGTFWVGMCPRDSKLAPRSKKISHKIDTPF